MFVDKTNAGLPREHGAEVLASPPTLARLTYGRLRADLLAGFWMPGRKLLMHELRERYQVGASPLREALNRLASEDWVVHSDQRGFTVAAASEDGLRDLVQTRIAVEGLALEQAMQRQPPGWEDALVLGFHRLARTPRSLSTEHFDENPEWERLHRAFHRGLLAGCESPLLLEFCSQLYDQAYRYRRLAAQRVHAQRNELDEHRAVFDAVIDGNLAEARRLLAVHYQRTAGILGVETG